MPSRQPSVFLRLVATRRGATAIEYALVAGLISVATIAVLIGIGERFQNALDAVANAIN